MEEPIRTDSGYRLYSDADIKRVKFIKQMQNLGFSLNEIYKLLGVVDQDSVRCQNMFDFVSQKQIEVQKQIADLKQIESMLGDLKERCPNEKEMYACPIIETLIYDE